MLIVIVSVCCSDVYELWEVRCSVRSPLQKNLKKIVLARSRIIRTAILWTWCCDKENVKNVYLNMIFLHYNNMSFLYIYDNLCVSTCLYVCNCIFFSVPHMRTHTLRGSGNSVLWWQ